MKSISITEIEVTPEVAAALCPYDEHNRECYSKGLQSCGHCQMNNPKDGDLILLRVKRAQPEKPKSEIMIGS